MIPRAMSSPAIETFERFADIYSRVSATGCNQEIIAFVSSKITERKLRGKATKLFSNISTVIGRGLGVGGRESEVGGRRSEVGGLKSDWLSQKSRKVAPVNRQPSTVNR